MLRLLLRQLLFVVYLTIIVFVLLEIVLRIYNPLNPRVKNDKIILPIRKTYELNVEKLPQLNTKVIHTKNSLGFRGAEPPKDWAHHLTVMAVGGSTTECFFLNDGTDWPTRLGQRLHPSLPDLWINNAGLNGHSTFGHQVLVDDYLLKLHPKVILFLIGVNDVGRGQMDGFDKTLLKNTTVHIGDSWWKDLGRTLTRNSEVIGLIQLVSRGLKTQKIDFHDNVNLSVRPSDTLTIAPAKIQAELALIRTQLPDYHERVLKLLTTCRKAGIEPILITQPLLVGAGIDPVTKTDLAKFRLHGNENGELHWQRLEAYNDVTRAIAAEQHIHLIELARTMPKSSAYYYDEMHFTQAGADKVSEILATDLGPYLKAKYEPAQRLVASAR